MNIIELNDDEILAVVEPMWTELVRASNDGDYGKFIRNFSYDLLYGLTETASNLGAKIREIGLKEALTWRDSPYEDLRGSKKE